MRLGKDVLEADLYGDLGVLPDATESEIRVAYRRSVRTSHPDLNREDPGAAARMLRVNTAARVLLDAALRRTYDRERRRADSGPASAQRPASRPAWFERRERVNDGDWAPAPPPAGGRAQRAPFSRFFRELRGRDARFSLTLHELVESLSVGKQLAIAAALFALALGLIAVARPQGLIGGSNQPTSVRVDSVYP